jgi:hypothetical protein
MALDICTPESAMQLSNLEWAMLRTFAEANGWTPQGTRAPDPSIWPKKFIKQGPKAGQRWDASDYTAAEFQEVSSEDASNMADALRAGIEAIKNGERDPDLMEMFFPEEVREVFGEIPPPEEVRDFITKLSERFIYLCEGGPFLIGYLRTLAA